MVKTERKAMGKSNKIKNTDRNGILLALEKDLEFIKSVATNHKNWTKTIVHTSRPPVKNHSKIKKKSVKNHIKPFNIKSPYKILAKIGPNEPRWELG